jgi:hypothetical protein
MTASTAARKKPARKPASGTAALPDTRRLARLVPRAPWILRITEWAKKPAPLFIVKERIQLEDGNGANSAERPKGEKGTRLVDRGLLYGESQRRLIPVLRKILRAVHDEAGIPLELDRFLAPEARSFRGNLPLDDEAGAKLALVFRLQERLNDLDRVELIARRVRRFTREEAGYWLSRITHFTPEEIRWAQAGMRIMLGGQPHDPAVERLLERLRAD